MAWERSGIAWEFDGDDSIAERLRRKTELPGESDVLVAESH